MHFHFGTYNCDAFQVNSNVTFEYNSFWGSNCFIPCNTLNTNSNSLTNSLLNIRSLRIHLQDILKDKNLMENDLLCLTEIQICPENDVSDIKQQLDTYKVHSNVEGDRYQNVGSCLSRSVKVNKHENFPGVSILEIVKESFCSATLRILFLYCSPSYCISYTRLETVLSTYKTFEIILGHFNINIIGNNNMQQVMS